MGSSQTWPLRARAARGALCAVLSVALAVPGGGPLRAQVASDPLRPLDVPRPMDNLPRLGEAGGEELTPQAERRLADAIMRQVRRDPTHVDDAEVQDFLAAFAAPLSATPATTGFQFDLFVMRDNAINAFALPGGHIGVHSGLIAASHTESELASVLAHEMGHVVQRHIGRMLAQQRQMSTLAMTAMIVALLAARSSPDAAMGSAMLGDQVARQGMLSFSRDAEREADRVGLDILRQAGFDPRAMVSFFMRLQQANRVFEGGAPSYLRTHPLTGERIYDMQLRLQDERYRQRPDSLEFALMRARMRAVGDLGSDGLRNARQAFENRVTGDRRDEADAWYGLASVAAAQRDFARSDAALVEARRLIGRDHPYLARQRVANRLAAGDSAQALAASREAIERFPDARALVRLHGEALLANRRGSEAVGFLDSRLADFRSDGRLWHLLAESHGLLDQRALAHRAAAEEFALAGAWQAAVEQLRMAQRAGDADFFVSSMIDARLAELQSELRREIEEQRSGRFVP
jgi:beta-barrel assembly-enhancing protease